jgi:phosphatidylinositol alpha-1,6-mannosyltransferase
VKHLLVTNDFPPKHGGIQSYLWELWRRLPADGLTVLTSSYPGAAAWDAQQGFRIDRLDRRVLLPTRRLTRLVDRAAAESSAELVLLDPALPLGLIGPGLASPYGLVLHGAEVTVPGRLPGARQLLGRVLRGASIVVAAGGYPAAEAERAAGRPLPTVRVPPGVDTTRFRPLDPYGRRRARERLGLPADALVVLGLSRLVPRKGFDVLLRAAARLAPSHPRMLVVIAGSGRDRGRLERIATECAAPVRFLGRIGDEQLAEVYGCADVFAMLCRDRWAGLEREGFGIVFLEAAACGVPQVAGASGGAAEAVLDGVTGLVVRGAARTGPVADSLARLLDDDDLRVRMGEASRRRAVESFSYDRLAESLRAALDRWRTNA